MPNGFHNAQCHHCKFYRYRKSGRCCRKHDFIMPRFGEVICKDYIDSGGTSSLTDSLRPGELYVYSYASNEPPQSLGQFSEVQTDMFSVTVRADLEFGWVVFTNDDDPFPDTGKSLAVIVDGDSLPFRVVHAEREYLLRATKLPDNTWKTIYATQSYRILVPVDRPLVLHDWLNSIFDLEANANFVRNHEMRHGLDESEVFVIARVVTPLEAYELIPDFVQHIATFRRTHGT